MEIDNKYTIADALAKAYKTTWTKAYIEEHRPLVFGVILHTQNSQGKELIDSMKEEDAIHIVNLTINRLLGKGLTKVIVDAF